MENLNVDYIDDVSHLCLRNAKMFAESKKIKTAKRAKP